MRAFALVVALFLGACSPSDGSGQDAGLRADGGACSDTQNDPNNCGACGRTCIVPNATAGCEVGECTIAACPPGLVDDDGEIANGCELAEDEEPGPLVCSPESPEICNAFDDNCDEQCDEGREAGCRQGVHRAYAAGHHIFSSVLSDVTAPPFTIEVQNFFHTYAAPGVGLIEAFLCDKGDGTHLLTTSSDCEGNGTVVRSIGYWSVSLSCGSTALYRLYSASGNNHFYTTSAPERDNAMNNLAYVYQGIAGYVWSAE